MGKPVINPIITGIIPLQLILNNFTVTFSEGDNIYCRASDDAIILDSTINGNRAGITVVTANVIELRTLSLVCREYMITNALSITKNKNFIISFSLQEWLMYFILRFFISFHS